MTGYFVFFAVCFVVLIGWYLYMMTCQPEKFEKMVKLHTEHQQAQQKMAAERAERRNKALGVLAGIAVRILKR